MKFSVSASAALLSLSASASAFTASTPSLTRIPGAFARPSAQSNANVLRMSVADSKNTINVIPSSSSTSTSLNAATLTAGSEVEQVQEQEEEKSEKSYLDDGFVFGLDGSGIERPKGKSANIVVDGDSLETQPYQVAAVAGTFIGHAYFAAMAVSHMLALNDGNAILTAAQSLILVASSLVLADLGSGILHWSVDNYGNGRTPIMGGIIAAFQGHHSAPWTITYRGFCNNVYKLCIPFGIPTIAAINALAGPSNPGTTLFFTVFCAVEILSQEMHKWSHMTKGQCPGWVNWLQDVGLSIGRTSHALHHQAPYDGNYCIISGVCNEALDKSGFFRRLEHLIYRWNGVESNAWKLDPELRARTLRGEYKLEA